MILVQRKGVDVAEHIPVCQVTDQTNQLGSIFICDFILRSVDIGFGKVWLTSNKGVTVFVISLYQIIVLSFSWFFITSFFVLRVISCLSFSHI
jgi:hypothetical protein